MCRKPPAALRNKTILLLLLLYVINVPSMGLITIPSNWEERGRHYQFRKTQIFRPERVSAIFELD